MEIKELFIPYKDSKTYVRMIVGNPCKTPLILIHGGPGSTHNSFECLDIMSNYDDRTIIMYDQYLCGKSIGGSKEKVSVDNYLDELENIIVYFNFHKVHLLGHSFGGMLIIMLMCDKKPKYVSSIILADSLSSASLWSEESHRLIDSYMPNKYKKIIKKCEIKGDFDNKKFKKATELYIKMFLASKLDEKELPENVLACKKLERRNDSYSYEKLWGKSEFSVTGELKNYEYTEKLSNISVPTLLISGSEDESTPYQNKIMYDHLKCFKKWHLFQNSRHMTYYDYNIEFIKLVVSFLNSIKKYK